MNAALSRRRLLACALPGLALASLEWPNAARAIEPGQTVPATSVAGTTATLPLIDGKSRATYVDFWASWCGPCRQSFPWMNRMHAKFSASGLRIVAVNLDADAADARRFLAQLPASFTVAFDPSADLARRMGIKTMPSSVLADAHGKVVSTHGGFVPEDAAALEAMIASLLAA